MKAARLFYFQPKGIFKKHKEINLTAATGPAGGLFAV
jgi:hypothetical protein